MEKPRVPQTPVMKKNDEPGCTSQVIIQVDKDGNVISRSVIVTPAPITCHLTGVEPK